MSGIDPIEDTRLWLERAVIGLNLGYPAVALAGAAMAGSGLILVLLLVRREARTVAVAASAGC